MKYRQLETGYYQENLPSLGEDELVLEPEDLTNDQWEKICELFLGTDPKKTTMIVFSKERQIEYFIEN